MSIDQTIQRRFAEVQAAAEEVSKTRVFDFQNDKGHKYYQIPYAAFAGWATNALSLIRAVMGEDSIQFKMLLAATGTFKQWESEFDSCKAIFLAAKQDYEGGYLFNVESALSGEILTDFVSLARAALKDGSKDVAAVLASAALEDTLKRYANRHGLAVDDKSMQDVVAAIKTKGLVTGAQKSLLDTMPKLRDYAMHANWGKLTAPDVASMIAFVEQFLLTNFS